MTSGGEVHLALAFNPSHLEIVSPVVQGSVRARQDRRRDKDGKLVIPVTMHGDSAFAGQGVVMETLQMSQTRGLKPAAPSTLSSTTKWALPPTSVKTCAPPNTALMWPK